MSLVFSDVFLCIRRGFTEIANESRITSVKQGSERLVFTFLFTKTEHPSFQNRLTTKNVAMITVTVTKKKRGMN